MGNAQEEVTSADEANAQEEVTSADEANAQVEVNSAAFRRPLLNSSDGGCSEMTLKADTASCNAFYKCSMERVWVKQFCPGSLHFDPSKNVCSYPDISKCDF